MAASSTPNGTIIQGFGFGVRSMAQRYLGFVQKQVPDRRSISNKTTLTLTLSRPTGEGRGEGKGPQTPKLFLNESLAAQNGVKWKPTGFTTGSADERDRKGPANESGPG